MKNVDNKLKINCLFILLCLCSRLASLFSQTTIHWGDSIVVATEPAYITAPRVALLPDGTPIVTWGASTNPPKIWLSRLENGQFTMPVDVTNGLPAPELFGFGGYDLAVSGSDVFVVFEKSQAGILLAHSGDGGLSFELPVTVQGPIPGGSFTLASVATDEQGNPVVSYIKKKNGATWQFRRSTDGGLTFLPAVEASAAAEGGAVCECCTSDLLVSGDSVWMVFRNNDNNLRDIWVSHSTDAGASFDLATDVDDTDWVINACPISGPRMARLGESILTVWMSGGTGPARVFGNTLHGGTMQPGWQFNFPTADTITGNQNQVDVVARGDTVGVVFQENGKEIVFTFSSDGTGGLNSNFIRFAVPGHILRYAALAFRDGIFHLAYVDATSGQVLYRQGIVAPIVAAKEPAPELAAISVFPNPVSEDFFWVQSETTGLLDCTLFDVFGKKCFSKKASGNSVKLEVEGVPQGIYFLKIMADQGETIRKLIRN